MVDANNTKEFLTCLICLEIAKNAVECDACVNIMCEGCADGLKKKECPSCRKANFKPKPSILARRMIGTIPCSCPNECGETSTIGNLEDHLRRCPKRTYICGGIEECKFEGKREEFLHHIIEKHG